MRKSILIGKDFKSEKNIATMFSRIIKKLKSSQDIRFSILYLLRKIKNITKAKAIALINNDYEVFCDFSNKHRNLLRRIYKKNKYRWNNYFNQGVDFIDCFADIRMHNYFDYKSLKLKSLYDTILMKTTHKKNYDDGIIVLKNVKEKEKLTSIASYIYGCYKLIYAKHKLHKPTKPAPPQLMHPPNKKVIQSSFLICNNRIIFDDLIFRYIYHIDDNESIAFLPYIFETNTPMAVNDIVNIKNNKNVLFDLLITYKKQKKWLRVEGIFSNFEEGNAIFDGVFIDITILKRRKLFINLNKIAHKHRARIKKEVNFEYLIKDDIIYLYGNIFDKKITHIPHQIYRFSKQISLLNIRNSDGEKYLMDLLSGLQNEPFEIHLISDLGNDLYYEIDGTVIYHHIKPIKVIGVIKNITIRKIRELELKALMQRDLVTGFYNYANGFNLIQDRLKENIGGSLLAIDIDDFNVISEMYGSIFSNIIIKEISTLIKSIFNDAIILRNYRDGFIIYMQETIDEARKKANLLLAEAKNIYIDAVELSMSVGIVDTDYSRDLNQLIEIGGQTLLYSKSCGGDIVATYRDIDSTVINNLIVLNRNEIISDYLFSSSNYDLIAFTIEILMKAKNFKSVLKILLKRIKDAFNLERVTVYEYNYRSNESRLYCGWNEFGEQTSDEVIPISEAELNLIFNSIIDDEIIFDHKNLSRFNDKLNNEIIRYSSYRQLLYFNNQKANIKFFIIFSVPIHKQFWNSDNKINLRVIANIMLAFLMKEHDKNMVQIKTDYLSNMSHEIRTPLNGIIGMTKIAKNIVDDPERINNALANIDLSSQYLLSLVNNILDMSRIESEKMKINKEPFFLSNLIDDLEAMMRVQAEQKQIKFQVVRKFSNRLIIGDTLRISQVLVNLLGNAIKFTGENGHVAFHITETIIDNKSHVKFVIKDSGIGIRKDKALMIFESFEQAHANTANKYGGSGLGLSISNSLVKLMGGNLEVISEEGKGSEFFFTLVFNHDSKSTYINFENKHPDEEYIPSHVFIGKRILLVEDDKLNLEIIKVLLENVGFKVEIANNGKDAIEMYAKSKLHYYDTILMDIKMPVMDGYEATTLIRSLGRVDSPTIPIVAMSAKAFEEDISEAFRYGMNGYITKPIDMKYLYQELEKILDKK